MLGPALHRVREVVAGLAGVEQQPQESERYGSWEAGPAQFGVAKKVRDNDPALHEDQTLYSCGSLAPKMRSGGGGCTDAKFRKEKLNNIDGSKNSLVNIEISNKRSKFHSSKIDLTFYDRGMEYKIQGESNSDPLLLLTGPPG